MDLISCLMPTYNRPTRGHTWMIEEAIECFLRQDTSYETTSEENEKWRTRKPFRKELIILNDTRGQRLKFDHPEVKIFNIDERLPDLSAKVQWMIDHSEGNIFCRWDDDDLSLPHRLSFSRERMGDELEWRASNYFYDPGNLYEVNNPGNSHVMAMFRRECLDKIGGYPVGYSGGEDQAFNRAIAEAGINSSGQFVPTSMIYYVYRWATGSHHLSGKIDTGGLLNTSQSSWDELGTRPIAEGEFELRPHWRRNYVYDAAQKVRLTTTPRDPFSVPHYCNFQELYKWAVAQAGVGATFVEVGCWNGASVCYLAKLVQAKQHRGRVIAVDPGVGIRDRFGKDMTGPRKDYAFSSSLLESIRECGVQDTVTPIIEESTRAASLIADASVDFVFIDGDHDYQSVRSDLQAWWPKVKPGGVIAGHDYMGSGYPGVAKAVDEFFGVDRLSLQAQQSSSCWMRRK